MGLVPECSCKDLASLPSDPTVFTPEQLALASSSLACALGGTHEACILAPGSQLFCHVDLDAAAANDLSPPLEIESNGACVGGETTRPLDLRIVVGRLCERDGGGFTAWAQVSGMSGLWTP